MQKKPGSVSFLCLLIPLGWILFSVVRGDLTLGLFRFHPCHRTSANMNAAIATVESIGRAQEQAKAAMHRDADGDGIGEYGYLPELAGCVPFRTSSVIGDHNLSAAILPTAFGDPTPGGLIDRQGYLFRVFLPGATLDGRTAPHPMSADGCVNELGPFLDPDNTEALWSVYAWPANRRAGSTHVIFLNQEGVVLSTENADFRYLGESEAPNFDAALRNSSPADMRAALATGEFTSNDGCVWAVLSR